MQIWKHFIFFWLFLIKWQLGTNAGILETPAAIQWRICSITTIATLSEVLKHQDKKTKRSMPLFVLQKTTGIIRIAHIYDIFPEDHIYM